MLVDNCSAHTNINSSLSNIFLVFLPANTTSIMQPLDQGIIKKFKVHYQKILIAHLLQKVDPNQSFQISLFDALFFIKQAWTKVSEQTIINCFYHSKILVKGNSTNFKVDEITQVEINEILMHAPDILSNADSKNVFLDIDDNTVSKANIEAQDSEEELPSAPLPLKIKK